MKFRNGKQQGYTLINVMLLLAAMAVIATLAFRDQAFKLETQRAVIAGQQMKMVNDAISGYISAHAKTLRGMVDSDCSGNSSCTPSTWFCAPVGTTGDQCELNFTQLIAEGYLPPNWQNVNVWGSPYKSIVTRVLKINAKTVGNEMDYDLRVISVTQTPWQDSTGKPLLGLLGQAVKAGGVDMAMTSSTANAAQGLVRRAYNAAMTGGTMITWSADNSMNPYINGIGQLVARAGFESRANAAFTDLLRRDGGSMMRADLDMGSNKVNNVQDAFLHGAGGRNVAALAPTWVFKYSWRIGADGATIQKPDCRAQSGGWTNRTTLTNPWDPSYAPASDPNKSYDSGEPRILVLNDYLSNMKALGFYESGAACASGLDTTSPAQTTSCPANDAFYAYDPAFRARARAAYTFWAVDNGANWQVFMRYHQDNTYNTNAATGGATTDSKGIASVYCYYDNQAASGCNGELGCTQSGNSGSAAAAPDLAAPPVATTTNAYQPLDVSGSNTKLPPGTPLPPGAGDVAITF